MVIFRPRTEKESMDGSFDANILKNLLIYPYASANLFLHRPQCWWSSIVHTLLMTLPFDDSSLFAVLVLLHSPQCQQWCPSNVHNVNDPASFILLKILHYLQFWRHLTNNNAMLMILLCPQYFSFPKCWWSLLVYNAMLRTLHHQQWNVVDPSLPTMFIILWCTQSWWSLVVPSCHISN